MLMGAAAIVVSAPIGPLPLAAMHAAGSAT